MTRRSDGRFIRSFQAAEVETFMNRALDVMGTLREGGDGQFGAAMQVELLTAFAREGCRGGAAVTVMIVSADTAARTIV